MDDNLNLESLSPMDEAERRTALESRTVTELKALMEDIGIAATGNKPDLVNSILDALRDPDPLSNAASSGTGATPEDPSEAVIPKPDYAPPGSVPAYIDGLSDEELVEEIRSWTGVPRLPDDHGFSTNDLRGYLAALHLAATTGRPRPAWTDYDRGEE